MGESLMANITVTFTITEFCLHTGVTEEELNEIVGLGVIAPYENDNAYWPFDDRAARVTQRPLRLRTDLAPAGPGTCGAVTPQGEN